MNLRDLLARARSGGAFLFCGAGFSADCLGISEYAEVGTGSQLRDLLNRRLSQHNFPTYQSLSNASDKYKAVFGTYELFSLLREKYIISNVTQDTIDIVAYPWTRIYTTNYDNAIELALTRANKTPKPLNNLDVPENIPGPGTEVIHLHGAAEKWNVSNFDQSCILGTESYLVASHTLKHWRDILQTDIERSQIFVFVGFAANDIHLEEVIYNATRVSRKIYFINSSTSQPDPDMKFKQEKFGHSFPIGRKGLSKILEEATNAGSILPPNTPSFVKYERSQPSGDIPSTQSLEDLFLYGSVDESHLVRDFILQKNDYHVQRCVVDDVISHVRQHGTISLITGEICDGKSIVLHDVMIRAYPERPIFTLCRAYDTLLKELRELLEFYEEPIISMENAFDLPSREFHKLIEIISNSQASLVLTDRNISAFAEISDLQNLANVSTYEHFETTELSEDEMKSLITLSDQVALLTPSRDRGAGGRSWTGKHRRSLPRFLIELINSENAKSKYTEQFQNFVAFCSREDIKIIVSSLYIAHIGHNVPLSLLSNSFERDAAGILQSLHESQKKFQLVRLEGDNLKTVPSIGATNILKEIVPQYDSRIVVDSVVDLVAGLARIYSRSHTEHYLLNQMMRYSILRSVVNDTSEINRFFDNVSKSEYCRSRVLFWLQWHMAMVDQLDFDRAGNFLTRSEQEAERYERRTGRRYDRVQIEDRKAKFLLTLDRNKGRQRNFVADLREASRLTIRLLRRSEVTHHPYETFQEMLYTYEEMQGEFEDGEKDIIWSIIQEVGKVAEQRVGLLMHGYPRNRATDVLEKYRGWFTVRDNP